MVRRYGPCRFDLTQHERMNRLGSAAVEKEKPPDYATAWGLQFTLIARPDSGDRRLGSVRLGHVSPRKVGTDSGDFEHESGPEDNGKCSRRNWSPPDRHRQLPEPIRRRENFLGCAVKIEAHSSIRPIVDDHTYRISEERNGAALCGHGDRRRLLHAPSK